MSDIDYQEQLARFAQATAEIRFIKEQQWKTSYYALLLFSGIIALFITWNPPPSFYIKLLASTVSLAAGTLFVIFHVNLSHSLHEYRSGLDSIEEELQHCRAQSYKREAFAVPSTAESKKKRARLYSGSFISMTIVTAFFSVIVIHRSEIDAVSISGRRIMTIDLSLFNWQSISALSTIAAVVVALVLPSIRDRRNQNSIARRTRERAMAYLRMLAQDLEEIVTTGRMPDAMSFISKNQSVISNLEAIHMTSQGLSERENSAFADLVVLARKHAYIVSSNDPQLDRKSVV